MSYYRHTGKARAASLHRQSWLMRGSLVAVVFTSLLLIYLSSAGHPIARNLRSSLTDGLISVVKVVSAPTEFVNTLRDRIGEISGLYAENQRLKQENQRLMQWQNVATKLQAENASLHRLVGLKPAGKLHYVSARVVGGPAHLYSERVVIDSGRQEGVAEYQAVINHEGLVGRVMEVGNRSAQVIAITDINSRIPVIGEESRDRAILSGDNSEAPVLMHLAKEPSIRVGERVVTADDGGVFPGGIAVGEVVAIEGNDVRVKPYADFDKLEYVSIVSESESEELGR